MCSIEARRYMYTGFYMPRLRDLGWFLYMGQCTYQYRKEHQKLN